MCVRSCLSTRTTDRKRDGGLNADSKISTITRVRGVLFKLEELAPEGFVNKEAQGRGGFKATYGWFRKLLPFQGRFFPAIYIYTSFVRALLLVRKGVDSGRYTEELVCLSLNFQFDVI